MVRLQIGAKKLEIEWGAESIIYLTSRSASANCRIPSCKKCHWTYMALLHQHTSKSGLTSIWSDASMFEDKILAKTLDMAPQKLIRRDNNSRQSCRPSEYRCA